jgi:TRAP-type C4-dicarboxylate transport system substrate-binding protein
VPKSARVFAQVSVACVAFLFALPSLAATSIRLATLAPKSSTWGKVIAVWQKAIEMKTDNALTLDVYYNGVQGDEKAMVAKMRTGLLDGAALSSVGLSVIYRDIMVLQLPGVTNSWPLVDLVRNMLKEPMEDGFRREGFEVLGWGDIGLVYQMSKGVEVRRPADLRGRRPLAWRNEPTAPMFFSLVGQVVSVPLDPTEVLPALRTGTVDVIAAPALAAEQLQWTPYLDHINEQVIVAAIGATLMKKSSLDALSADTREMLRDMEHRVSRVESDRIRKLDIEARERLKQKMTVVHLSDDDKVEWYRIFLKAVKRMRHGIFSAPLIDRVLEITGKD